MVNVPSQAPIAMELSPTNETETRDFRKIVSRCHFVHCVSDSAYAIKYANEEELTFLGEALEASEFPLTSLELQGGCFCKRGTKSIVADDLCDYIEDSANSLQQLILRSDDPQTVCHEIPRRLICAYADNAATDVELVLEGLNLAKLRDAVANLVQQGKLKRLHLKHMLEIDVEDVMVLKEALTTEVDGFETLILEGETPPQLFRATMLGFAENPTICSLQFTHLEEEEAAPLCQLIGSCPRLRTIDFTGLTNIRVTVMDALAATFASETSPTTMDFTHCNLTPHHVPALRELVRKMPNLKHLKLADNALGLDGFRDLCMGLNDNDTIEKLELNRNGITGGAVWGLLSGLFMYNHTVIEIRLNENDLSGCNEKTWEALARNETLRVVDLSDSLEDMSAVVGICTAFQAESYAIKLECREVPSESNGMFAFSLGMTKQDTEHHLYRQIFIKGECEPGERYEWLCELLTQESCSIHTLAIPRNFCAVQQWDSTMRLITECKSVHTICLNVIDEVTADCLYRNLPGAKYLRTFHVKSSRDSGMSSEARNSLRKAMEMNRSLFWIHLGFCIEGERLPRAAFYGLRNRMESLHDIPIALIPRVLTLRRRPLWDGEESEHCRHATFLAIKLLSSLQNTTKPKRKRSDKCRIHIQVAK